MTSLRYTVHAAADLAIAATAGLLVIAFLPVHFTLLAAKALIRSGAPTPPATVRSVR